MSIAMSITEQFLQKNFVMPQAQSASRYVNDKTHLPPQVVTVRVETRRLKNTISTVIAVL